MATIDSTVTSESGSRCTTLVEQARPAMEQVARRRLTGVSETDVEDVVQQAMLSLWKACKAGLVPISVAAIATAIATCRCADFLRCRTRKRTVKMDALPDEQSIPDPYPAESVHTGRSLHEAINDALTAGSRSRAILAS